MNEHPTPSILQRVLVILAVTAASYGLPTQAQGHRSNGDAGHARQSAATDPNAEQSARDTAIPQH